MRYDPILNCKRTATEDDVEREFWRLVESIAESVEVEYGADIHSTAHGSGFPTIEKNPLNPYSTDPWNLNNLPLHSDSLFQHIKSDVSGMTVPWLYVGMCFSTFCWHNEDHYSYSANYQHFGATKTWYGIPGADAERFEEAMKQAVPELFETQPDLLFQLVTLLPPDQLKKAGVNVYALDQRAGQFVITFPQAYHAGFNHGFNFNEAVNFAPHDWEPFGEAGVERLQAFRKQPCFSHDELLITASSRDTTIATAKWLGPALVRLRDRESKQRASFLKLHKSYDDHHCKVDDSGTESGSSCELGVEIVNEDSSETEQCIYCKAYCYLSYLRCHSTSKVVCLLHAESYKCCIASDEQRFTGSSHTLRYRFSHDTLQAIVQKIVDRAAMPEAWQEKLDKILEEEPKPSLKVLKSLVSEGERIPYELPGLSDLKSFVARCNEWVDEAMNYTTRKHQNRRKNERAWRKGNLAKAAELEERDREVRKIENMHRLLAKAEEISFDCPEITALAERSEDVAQFQRAARAALRDPGRCSTQEIEALAEEGKVFNLDIPEVEELDQVVRQMKWNEQARERKGQFQTLEDASNMIETGVEIGIPEHNEYLMYHREQLAKGQVWEAKAKELISVEAVHYQQLEALSRQAGFLPVSQETLAAVDAILTKQREAHRQIMSMYERCKDPDFRKRPRYKDVRDVLDGLSELNSKPSGTLDLEKEIKRHEDWMRKGKKLFGKANAPLHILHIHMNHVLEHNTYCFDLQDKPRMPVEPSSRANTPAEEQDVEDVRSARDVFCMCRQSEAGMMIECELCHEWFANGPKYVEPAVDFFHRYHGKCLKVARGKIKDDDKYTCPICDWRVKIPRDAARPKLEDLQDWQNDIPHLPFQPEEEDTLEEIINSAQTFRDFMRPYTNPITATPDEVTTQRFYLRKIEGAEVLLAHETNFFRQELHKWAPVAPEPPPLLENSLSTRKPRPTKQQKLMTQLGIDNPDDLPQQFRTKQHSFTKARKNGESHSAKGHHPLQPAPRHRHRSSTPNSASTQERQTHSRQPPRVLSDNGNDSVYPNYYPMMSPRNNSHHRNPSSPNYGHGSYIPNQHHHHSHSTFVESPGFAPGSPIGRSGPPLDPSLFSPTNSHFAASMSRPSHHEQMLSPQQHGFSGGHNRRDSLDNNIFDDFVADPSDDMGGRNEAAEALEERRRDDEDDQGRIFADAFINHA